MGLWECYGGLIIHFDATPSCYDTPYGLLFTHSVTMERLLWGHPYVGMGPTPMLLPPPLRCYMGPLLWGTVAMGW